MRRRTRSVGTVLKVVVLAGAVLTAYVGVSGPRGGGQAAQLSSRGQIQPLGQAEQTDLDPVEVPPVEISPLRIRAIPGITTTTHVAPPRTMIPAGTTVVLECGGVGMPGDVELRWVGADEVERSAGTAAARCVLHEPGEYLVKMEVRSGGTWTTLRRCALTAVDIAPEQINILPITASAAPLDVDESSSNETTMLYYYGWFSFGESIAQVRDRGDGHLSTSIERDVTFTVQTDPPGFEPLVEWNVHGHSGLDDLGPSITRRYSQVGSFTLSAGAALNGPVAHLETYSVTITSHVSNRDIAPDGQPVTFTAVTDPPGYEDDITWLSSTKYGTGTPVLGTGSTFTVQFDDTWGTDAFQWLGVRADNTRFNQDQKCQELVDFANSTLMGAFREQVESSLLTTEFQSTIEVLGWTMDFGQGIEILATINYPNEAPADARYAWIPTFDDATGAFRGVYGYTASDMLNQEGAEFMEMLDQSTMITYTSGDFTEWVEFQFDFDNLDACNNPAIFAVNNAGNYGQCYALAIAAAIAAGAATGLNAACTALCTSGVGWVGCAACAAGVGTVWFASWWSC